MADQCAEESSFGVMCQSPRGRNEGYTRNSGTSNPVFSVGITCSRYRGSCGLLTENGSRTPKRKLSLRRVRYRPGGLMGVDCVPWEKYSLRGSAGQQSTTPPSTLNCLWRSGPHGGCVERPLSRGQMPIRGCHAFSPPIQRRCFSIVACVPFGTSRCQSRPRQTGGDLFSSCTTTNVQANPDCYLHHTNLVHGWLRTFP